MKKVCKVVKTWTIFSLLFTVSIFGEGKTQHSVANLNWGRGWVAKRGLSRLKCYDDDDYDNFVLLTGKKNFPSFFLSPAAFFLSNHSAWIYFNYVRLSFSEISSVCEWRRIGYKSRKFTREITQHRLNRRKTCNLPPLFFSRPLRPPESLAIRTHFCCHPSIAIVMIIKHERIHFFTRCNRFQFSSLFYIFLIRVDGKEINVRKKLNYWAIVKVSLFFSDVWWWCRRGGRPERRIVCASMRIQTTHLVCVCLPKKISKSRKNC